MSVRGAALWLAPGGKEAPLKAGQGLDVGVELRTGEAGRVRLRCVDGSTLVLADRSRLLIELFEPAAACSPRLASFLLSVGLLGQKVQPVAEGRWQVRTPSAVTAVRGTEFLVEVARDQSTSVHVVSGSVAVEAQDEQEAVSAASPDYVSKSILTRGFRPPEAVVLDRQAASTQCQQRSGCRAASGGASGELQRLLGRLGGL